MHISLKIGFILLLLVGCATQDSPTAVPPTFTPIPTLTPTPPPNHYWAGDGVDSMEHHQIGEGAFLRFYDFPVKVWFNVADEVWILALDNAIQEINPIVPIGRIEDEQNADMKVYVLPAAAFLEHCQNGTDGCAEMTRVIRSDGKTKPTSAVYLLDQAAPVLVIHEMLHALGIYVHSPYSDDVMYAYSTATVLTERDKNTLSMLYSQPPYIDE